MTISHASPRLWAALTVVIALLGSTVAWAAGLVPVPLRSAIIIRSAGYERGFAERRGEAVLAVVVGRTGASAEDGRAMATSFAKLLTEAQIAGRKTRVIQITHEDKGKTADELARQRAEIVYFGQGLEGLVRDIPGQAGGIKRILVCANGADAEVGCTIGVETADDKPRLVLNLKQANSSGLRFPPEFLRLARIVR